MPLYNYEATNKEGRIVSGQLAADSRDEAVLILTRKKLPPIKIEERSEKKAALLSSISLFERFSALDRIILVRNLSTTIKAGLSIIESLDIMIADATKTVVKKILNAAKMNVQNGQPLYKTFEAYPQYFPSIFTGMVRAGESSGELDKTLDELSRHMSKEHALIKKVRSAMAYPVILLLASVGIVVMLLTFVMPRLTKSFAQSGVSLPATTRALVYLSGLLVNHWLLSIAAAAALAVFFTVFRKTAAGKKFFSALVFRIPVAKNLVKKVILVRVTRTFGSLMASATPVVEALQLTALSAGNHYYEQAILEAAAAIRNGASLSDSLRKYPELFPNMLTSLITVGEKTGTLETVLKTFADFFDEDVDGALKDLTTFLEPLLLLGMGLIIGLIAVSILMPIYQLVGKFV